MKKIYYYQNSMKNIIIIINKIIKKINIKLNIWNWNWNWKKEKKIRDLNI